MKRWKATGYIGYFWEGPTVELGTYRWRWLACLRADWWLAKWTYSQATVKPVDID